jgi:small subunit ribosomal protein S8
MNTDPISDFLTRLRNASRAGHKTVIIPMSKMKKEITQILFDQGFILNYKFDNEGVQGSIKIALKYDKLNKEPVIKKLERVSKPGLRKYTNSSSIPRVLNGLGINIISTSKGLMTGKKAFRENLGGEIICNVY